jgi:hypothetical protein
VSYAKNVIQKHHSKSFFFSKLLCQMSLLEFRRQFGEALVPDILSWLSEAKLRALDEAQILDLVFGESFLEPDMDEERSLVLSLLDKAERGQVVEALIVQRDASCFYSEPERGRRLRAHFGVADVPESRGQQFRAVVKKLTHLCEALWENLPEDQWPERMKKSTEAERKKNYQRVQHLALHLTKEANRESTSIVLNSPIEFVEMMNSQNVFAASRDFGDMAKEFEPNISDQEEFQAGRNAWAAFGLQILGKEGKASCIPAVLGYSLLYPFSDNYLDDPKVDKEAKTAFQRRFRQWLLGDANAPEPQSVVERRVHGCVGLVEKSWARKQHPEVFLALVSF